MYKKRIVFGKKLDSDIRLNEANDNINAEITVAFQDTVYTSFYIIFSAK